MLYKVLNFSLHINCIIEKYIYNKIVWLNWNLCIVNCIVLYMYTQYWFMYYSAYIALSTNDCFIFIRQMAELKVGWGSGSVRSGHQTVSDSSKNSFTFHFWHVFHPSWCERCRVIQQLLWMTERDILGAGQNIFWPLIHIFRGSRPPNPYDLRP